jgi:hypothetical protein
VTGAEVIALVAGLPAVIGAVTALIIAIRGNRNAIAAQNMVIGHLIHTHPDEPPSNGQ